MQQVTQLHSRAELANAIRPLQQRTHRKCPTPPLTSSRQVSVYSHQQHATQPAMHCTVSIRQHKQLLKAIKQQRRSVEQALRCKPAGYAATDAAEALSRQLRQILEQGSALHQVPSTEPQCVQGVLPEATVLYPTSLQSATSSVQTVVSSLAPPVLDVEDELLFEPRQYEVPGRVLVCQGSKCRAKGALGVLHAVSALTSGDNQVVDVLPCKCLGKCKEGPVMRVKSASNTSCSVYTQLEPQHIPAILDAHFVERMPSSSHEPTLAVAQATEGSACCTDCQQ